ncbi:hypothetical protein A3K73_02675 [Candidatus Pacearchaeota archaeon RBG_13_36_9]|nr:MAG: hypothetical protein A3K73_02675 [Candidatus Pacearchaeota archaeon RBG_13_36_9]
MIFWSVAVLLIFFSGYYLRAYLSLHTYLPYSPYEAFAPQYTPKILSQGPVKDFSDKAMRYPTTILLQRLINPIFGDLYLIYIAGAIVVFFLGKEITGKNIGGFLSFSLFALSSENLLQYTRTIGTSGLCYMFMWLSFLFLIRYIKNPKNLNLSLFIIFSLLALTSYHTGASALILILIGILVSLAYSKAIDKKIAFSICGLILFHIAWIAVFDVSQLSLLAKAVAGTGIIKIFYLILAALALTVFLYLAKDKKILESGYFPLVALILSAVLIFSEFPFFDFLLNLGANNYYVSTISLNNYLAQAILTHVYLLALLPFLIKKQLDKEQVFLRGWLIGLVLVFIALASLGYYPRIFDYSFPLMFVLFGLYWSKKKKFRIFIIAATIILLIASQLVIYNDPFTMRRYYIQEEVQSAEDIISLNLNGGVASDLRTSALFSYLGRKDVKFADSGEKLHDIIFYEYQYLPDLKIDYVILSESMKTVVYSTNFPTKPIDNSVFDYYKLNYKEVYNDKLMHVYKIK